MNDRIRQKIVLLGIACVLAAMLSGCGRKKQSHPTTAPVKGRVTFKGNPLRDAQVMFHPEGEGNPGLGVGNGDGEYRLTTYERDDGAVLGMHRVTVQVMPPNSLPGQEVQTGGGTVIPSRYLSKDTTPLKQEVKPGENTIDLNLE